MAHIEDHQNPEDIADLVCVQRVYPAYFSSPFVLVNRTSASLFMILKPGIAGGDDPPRFSCSKRFSASISFCRALTNSLAAAEVSPIVVSCKV